MCLDLKCTFSKTCLPAFFTGFQMNVAMVFAYFLLQHAQDYPEMYPPYYYEYKLGLCLTIYLLVMSSFLFAAFTDPGQAFEYRLPSSNRDCDKCKIKRADRSRHCSTCRRCGYRLDHHCVWVHNCIGMRNNKAFVLFLVYFLIGITQYIDVAYDYAFGLHEQPDMFPGFLAKSYFYFHNWIVLMFAFMVLTLFTQHVRFLVRNYTTVEYLEYRKEHGFLGAYDWCCKLPGTQYDQGAMANFTQVFGKDVLWWLLPTVPDNVQVEVGFSTIPEANS